MLPAAVSASAHLARKSGGRRVFWCRQFFAAAMPRARGRCVWRLRLCVCQIENGSMNAQVRQPGEDGGCRKVMVASQVRRHRLMEAPVTQQACLYSAVVCGNMDAAEQVARKRCVYGSVKAVLRGESKRVAVSVEYSQQVRQPMSGRCRNLRVKAASGGNANSVRRSMPERRGSVGSVRFFQNPPESPVHAVGNGVREKGGGGSRKSVPNASQLPARRARYGSEQNRPPNR